MRQRSRKMRPEGNLPKLTSSSDGNGSTIYLKRSSEVKRRGRRIELQQVRQAGFFIVVFRILNCGTDNAPLPRSTIETHGMSASGQRLPTPLELSIHKFHRDRQLQQLLMEQRQFSYGMGVQQFAVSLSLCKKSRMMLI